MVPLFLDLQVLEQPEFMFKPKTVQRMELLVMASPTWRLCIVTPFDFVDYFIRKVRCPDAQVDQLCCISAAISDLILRTYQGKNLQLVLFNLKIGLKLYGMVDPYYWPLIACHGFKLIVSLQIISRIVSFSPLPILLTIASCLSMVVIDFQDHRPSAIAAAAAMHNWSEFQRSEYSHSPWESEWSKSLSVACTIMLDLLKN